MIDIPSQREKVMFKTFQSKTLEIVEKMLYYLNLKLKVLLEVQLALFQKMEMKLFLMKVQILILFPLFLQKRFLIMIYLKLKDLLEIPNPCLLLKTSIQDLLLLICSLKKEFFKHSFLFLLISFMNKILMVCLNKKSLIK